MEQLTDLVRKAVGFTALRNDEVSVTNLTFGTHVEEQDFVYKPTPFSDWTQYKEEFFLVPRDDRCGVCPEVVAEQAAHEDRSADGRERNTRACRASSPPSGRRFTCLRRKMKSARKHYCATNGGSALWNMCGKNQWKVPVFSKCG